MRILAILVVLSLSLGLCACGNGAGSRAVEQPEAAEGQESVPSNQDSAEQVEPFARERELVAKFIGAYDSVAASPLEVQGAFAPSDRDSGHYRTEFRLGPFSNAYGLYCTAGDMGVTIVVYRDGNDLRVYADGPEDMVAQFYRDAFKALDPDVPMESVDEAIDLSREGIGQGFVTDSDLDSMLFLSKGNDSEAMLDSMHYGSSGN